MPLYDILFFVFALVTVGSACVVAFSRNIIYAAFALLFTFFGVAALYAMLYADFLAVTQILIYVGGILVLLLFGLMLTTKLVNVELKTRTLHFRPAAAIAAILVGSFAGLFYATWKGIGLPATGPGTTTVTIGEALMTEYMLPFEVASVILLVALIGAARMARRTRKSQEH